MAWRIRLIPDVSASPGIKSSQELLKPLGSGDICRNPRPCQAHEAYSPLLRLFLAQHFLKLGALSRRPEEAGDEIRRVLYKITFGSHDDTRVDVLGKAYSTGEKFGAAA